MIPLKEIQDGSWEFPNNFRLVVQSTKSDNGDIGVSWCIEPELYHQLNTKDKKYYVVLASAIYKSNTYCTEHDVQIVPLSQMMTYVRFNRSGIGVIFGWLISVDVDDINLRRFYKGKKLFTKNSCWTYIGDPKNIIYLDGSVTITPDDNNDVNYTGILVEISDKAFGHPIPNEKLDWYINWMHSSVVKDECSYRRRMLLSVLKLPIFIVYAIGLVLKRIIGLLLLLGIGYTLKDIQPKWSNLFNMDGYAEFIQGRDLWTDDGSEILKYSRFMVSDKNGLVVIPTVIILPIIPIVIFIISYMFERHIGYVAIITLSIWIWLMGIAIILEGLKYIAYGMMWLLNNTADMHIPNALIVVGGLGILGLFTILMFIFPMPMLMLLGMIILGTVFLKIFNVSLNKVRLTANTVNVKQVDMLLCEHRRSTNTFNPDDIISKQHGLTKWVLWFKNMKHNVCRPFRR